MDLQISTPRDPSEPGSSCWSKFFASNLGEWFGLDPKRQSSPLLWQRQHRLLTLEIRSHSSVVVERSDTRGLFENNG